MKHPVKIFKTLEICLKEIEPFIRDGQHIETGRPLKRFGGLRSREILANWLICVVINSITTYGRAIFSSDPFGGDGIICDTMTKNVWMMEHVLVPRTRMASVSNESLESQISLAIERKQSKGGASYASGKTLVVFLNAEGAEPWYPKKVAQLLPMVDFVDVWVLGLQTVEAGMYVYNVTELDWRQGNAMVWRVHIAKSFDGWEVEQIQ